MASAIEILTDPIMQAGTLAWKGEPDSNETNYFDNYSQAYDTLSEFI